MTSSISRLCKDAKSQNSVGVMYLEGKGFRQDYADVFQFFQKSAEQGDAEAQKNPLTEIEDKKTHL